MKKKTILLTAGIVLLLAATAFFVTRIHSLKPVAAFYDLDEPTQQAVKAQTGEAFTYVSLDTKTALSYQIKKSHADVLFTKGNATVSAARELASNKALIPSSALGGMTSSIRSLTTPSKEGFVTSLPLLTDHLEVNIDNRLLKTTKVSLPNAPSWNDLTKFALEAAKKENNPRILFAGKESSTLIDILGALAEALDGRSSYDSAAAILKTELEKSSAEGRAFNAAGAADLLAASPSSPLFSACQMISQWNTQKILYPEIFNLDSKSLDTLMDMNLSSIVIMPLSVHRTISQQAIQNYTSIYFPSYNPASNRFFTAPVVYAVPLTSDKEMLSAVQRLIEPASQEKLARASGIAPVLAQCRTPDRQADNVRYWVAASNTPLCGLSAEVFLTSGEKDELALALKALILHPKN